VITKDIRYTPTETKKEMSAEETQRAVDDIFKEADQTMATTKAKKIKSGPRLGKNKTNPLIKSLKEIFIVMIVFVVAICGFGVYALFKVVPDTKAQLVGQIQAARNELLLMDESDLTIDEYYQRKILLLITDDDVAAAVDETISLETIFKIASGKMELGIDIIPEEKRDEYEKIMEEYQQALENEKNKLPIENQTTTPTETHEDSASSTTPSIE
jgi:hypothetical protein